MRLYIISRWSMGIGRRSNGLVLFLYIETFSNAYKMLSRGAGKEVDVYWVLSGADIPAGMSFQPDRRPSKSAKGHYLLTVNETMKISSLVEKLKWVADRMSVIRAAGKVL